MKLNKRLTDLEARAGPSTYWVRVIQDCGQTEQQAIAAYEAEHGPIEDRTIVLRVIISKPGPAPAFA